MALAWLERVELLLYGASFICGVVSAAALAVAQGEFEGHCLLYGDVSYNSTRKAFTFSSFSNSSLCYFVSVISLLIALYCFCIMLYWVYVSCIDEVTRGTRWLNISVVVSVLILFFLLVSACILRVGTNILCDSIMKTKQVQKCAEAQDSGWVVPYDGSKFYTNLYSAESAAWVNFCFWIVVVVLLSVQRRLSSRLAPFQPLSGMDPEWTTSETEAIIGPQRS
ncbi:transmembrane protein 179B [Microcaecilia unicolor]|uniref:Transmembrane protein 179B n=1 Tax=Microcaecilia unicolor TaxID=1415580 RepID=A0A6P7ZG86_9AMPH|nr:transmembrane protein 179B [Microcaecilia unicolor]